MVVAVRAVVEDQDVSGGQRGRFVLLRKGRASETPHDLPRGSLDHHDGRDVSEADDQVTVGRLGDGIAVGPLRAMILWGDRISFGVKVLPAAPFPHHLAGGGHLEQVVAVYGAVGFGPG